MARNYFNYFTEIEEQFQRARGTGLFLLSPLDWALIENWKNCRHSARSGLKGIDQAFEKWRSRKVKRRLINSVAYCAQAVLEAAQRTPATAPARDVPIDAPFLRRLNCSSTLQLRLTRLRQRPEPPFQDVAASLEELVADAEHRPVQVSKIWSAVLPRSKKKLLPRLRTLESEEVLYSIRQALEAELRPYRGKMTADQLCDARTPLSRYRSARTRKAAASQPLLHPSEFDRVATTDECANAWA